MVYKFIFFLSVLVGTQTLVASETLFGKWSRDVVGTTYEILPAAPIQQLFVCTTGVVSGVASLSLTPMVMPLIPGGFYVKTATALGSALLGVGVICRRAIELNSAFLYHKNSTVGANQREELNFKRLMANAFLSSFMLPAAISALAVIVRYRGFPL